MNAHLKPKQTKNKKQRHSGTPTPADAETPVPPSAKSPTLAEALAAVVGAPSDTSLASALSETLGAGGQNSQQSPGQQAAPSSQSSTARANSQGQHHKPTRMLGLFMLHQTRVLDGTMGLITKDGRCTLPRERALTWTREELLSTIKMATFMVVAARGEGYQHRNDSYISFEQIHGIVARRAAIVEGFIQAYAAQGKRQPTLTDVVELAVQKSDYPPGFLRSWQRTMGTEMPKDAAELEKLLSEDKPRSTE